jgi:DNA-binding response OmpR family regulator
VAVLLIVEDDLRIRTALTRALTERGHAVSSEPAGLPALQRLVSDPPDLVVLDLGLPDVDGIQLLRMLRPVSSVPVIVATARDDDRATVAALDAGADDYIVKPFSADQLDARIRAILRRSATPEAAVMTVGSLTVDVRTRTAVLDGRTLDLRPREFDLLAYLAARPGEVVTKRTLLADVWQQPYGGADKTVDVHLSWLRRKLGETAAAPRMLHSVRGVGVKLLPAPDAGGADGNGAADEAS